MAGCGEALGVRTVFRICDGAQKEYYEKKGARPVVVEYCVAVVLTGTIHLPSIGHATRKYVILGGVCALNGCSSVYEK